MYSYLLTYFFYLIRLSVLSNIFCVRPALCYTAVIEINDSDDRSVRFKSAIKAR